MRNVVLKQSISCRLSAREVFLDTIANLIMEAAEQK
jgi:hypothetical protein